MKVFLVGGAVRDELLNRPVKDRDFVVVGSTPSEMLALGFEQVGADFPVFLHPETKEEWALARTERKTGKGYQGFAVDFDSGITLEDDLRRRDLTINAMAKNMETGEIIDPFNGRQDLNDRVLRHVSPAFAEDPLRVLRVARFCGRYNFSIAPETQELMARLVTSGELDALTPERVWVEMEKGFSEQPHPTRFIVSLMKCEAFGKLFPEVRVGGTFQRMRNVGNDLSFAQKLMIMFSDTPEEAVARVLEKYRASTEDTRQILNFKKLQAADKSPMAPVEVLDLLKKLDAFRRPEDFRALIEPARSYDIEENSYFDIFATRLRTMFSLMKDVTFGSLPSDQQALKGAEIGRAIDQERLKRLAVNIG